MAAPQTVPCVNINDEVVQVVSVNVKPGDFVKTGDVIGAVETDKSLLDVVAEQDGYVLRIDCAAGAEGPRRLGDVLARQCARRAGPRGGRGRTAGGGRGRATHRQGAGDAEGARSGSGAHSRTAASA